MIDTYEQVAICEATSGKGLQASDLQNAKAYFGCAPIGKNGTNLDFVQYSDGAILVFCEWFIGTMEDFLGAVKRVHGYTTAGCEYRAACDLAKIHFNNLEEN